jgi:hypothetical protein
LESFLFSSAQNVKGLKNIYTADNGNCTVTSSTVGEEKLELTLSCASQGNDTSESEEISLTIFREGKKKFRISETDEYSYKCSCDIEQETYSYSDEWSYVLIISDKENKERSIEDFSAKGDVSNEEIYKEGDKVHKKEKLSSTASATLYRRGKEYLTYVTANISNEVFADNYSYSLSYNIEETQPFSLNGTAVSNYGLTAVVKNVQFSSTPALPHDISSSSELIITSPDSSTFYVNMSKEPISSIAPGYECELDELLYSAASSNSTPSSESPVFPGPSAAPVTGQVME